MNIVETPHNAKAAGLFPLPAEARTGWLTDAKVVVPYTIIGSETPISKRYTSKEGRPVKVGSDAPLFRGLAERCELRGSATQMAGQLAEELSLLGPTNALICAPPPEPPQGKVSWPIVTEAERPSTPGAIARTKEFFPAIRGPALMGLDFDVKDYPAEIKKRLTETNLREALEAVFPEMAGAAMVSRPSMSVGIRHKGTGAATPDVSGLHRFLFVTNGEDIEAAAQLLADRLMLAGWLWGLVTAAGSILPKTLIDLSASRDVGRLWYEGTPVLGGSDLELVPEARKPIARPGGLLDLSSLRPLTTEETERLAVLKTAMRERYTDEAERARLGHRQRLRTKVPDPSKRKAFDVDHDRAVDRQELQGDFPIQLDDGRLVTPREILSHPNRYDGATCPDPLEPEYGGGRNKAILLVGGGDIRIESHAHGGMTYRICLKVDDVFEEIKDERGIEPQDPFGYGDTVAVLEPPHGALPAVIGDWATDLAERVGTPVAFPAAAAIAVISGAIGSKFSVQPKEHDHSWTEPGFLWLGLVESPGGKKSPIISAATAPLAKVNAEKVEATARAYRQWEQDAATAKKAKLPPPPEPKSHRNIVDNFTMEALAGVLVDNPAGVLVVQDELAGLIGSFDAYKAGGKGNDRQMMLRLFDGREASVDRVGRRHARVECWGASLLGGIQPRKITEMANNLEADGLLQRIIPIFGDGKKRAGADRAPDDTAKAAYYSVVQTLARAEKQITNPIRLSQEALTIWRPLTERIEALAELPGTSDAWRGHLGKWPGFSARLLLICHTLDRWGVELSEIDMLLVSAATASRAVKLVEWLLANSLRFYSECIGAGETGDDAQWIAGHILAKPITDKITRRDVGQARSEFRDKPERVARAMNYLVNIGWVNADTERRLDDRYGATQWTICPAVHDGRFHDRTELERKRRRSVQQAIVAAGKERSRLLGGLDG